MNDEPGSGPGRLRDLSVDDDRIRQLRVHVVVSGGLPSERVHFDAVLAGDGALQGTLVDAIVEREGSFNGRVADALLRDVVGLLSSDDFVGQPLAPPAFPPDTIVGSLEIRLGRELIGRYLGALDSEQVAGTDAETPATTELLRLMRQAAAAMIDGDPGQQPTSTA